MARRLKKTVLTPKEAIAGALHYSNGCSTASPTAVVSQLVAQNRILAVQAEAILNLAEIQKAQFAMATEAFESVKHLLPPKPPKRKRRQVKKGRLHVRVVR